jgi:hypothetical protein
VEKPVSTGAEAPASIETLRATLAEDLPVSRLRSLWRGRTDLWNHSPDVYLELARKLLRKGEPFLGYDVVSAGLRAFPGHSELRQTLALSLARMGATARANEILSQLESEGRADEQTLGLLGRTFKDLALAASDPAEREQHLDASYRAYRCAYEASRSPWTGINSATMSVLTGRLEEADAMASEVEAAVAARHRLAELGVVLDTDGHPADPGARRREDAAA